MRNDPNHTNQQSALNYCIMWITIAIIIMKMIVKLHYILHYFIFIREYNSCIKAVYYGNSSVGNNYDVCLCLDAAIESCQFVVLVLYPVFPDSRKIEKKTPKVSLFHSPEWKKDAWPHLMTSQHATVCFHLWWMQTVNDEYPECRSTVHTGGHCLPGNI